MVLQEGQFWYVHLRFILFHSQVDYYWNSNGWMTGVTFGDWLSKWNQRLLKQKRHILLLIDNAPCHMVEEEYSNIKVVFLPPNTTSKIQPLDQGIIRVTKCHYRKMICEMYLEGIQNEQEAKEIMRAIDFVVACQTIVKAWDEVKEPFITRCFEKCLPFTIGGPQAEEDDEPVPEPRDNIWENLQRALGVSMSFEAYATADDACESSEHVNEADIPEAVRKAMCPPEATTEISDADSDSDDELPCNGGSQIAPREEEIVHSSAQFIRLVGQQKAFLLRNNMPLATLRALEGVEQDLLRSRSSLCNRQPFITSFFGR